MPRLFAPVQFHKKALHVAIQAALTDLIGFRLDERIVATFGPHGQAHAQTFDVECAVPALGLTEHGEGKSRRVAEQDAARRMLAALKVSDRPGGPLRS